MSFDWNQVRAFLATAETGSFSAAARVLETTQPTIGRQITGLEESLGVTLFQRSVRGPVLTEAGRDLVDHVRLMGETATLISTVAAGQSQEVTGEVSVSATDLFSAAILPALLGGLREAAPGIHLRIAASNDISNLLQREADIAIRHVRPSESDLIARHVGDMRANLYAAAEYLDKVGRPRTSRSLADNAFIGGRDCDQLVSTLQDKGIPVRRENFAFSSENGVVQWELVKSGHGIAFMPEFLGETTPGVEKVFPDLPSLDFPVWLVTHRELRTSRRIRVVFDLLARELDKAM
ncbi:transcriptional regulator, LysR family [Aliiroseovarius halocynthiae]|nr:transcriptional regulator, LysR family [Aliiroseovarius halocynthiae]